MARGDAGRARDDEPGLRGAEGLEHLGRVAAVEQADDHDDRAGQREVLGQRAAAARAPSTLWALSITTVGSRRTTSNRPGSSRPANASVTTSSSVGAPKKASTDARASAALSPWWAPCTGR